MRLSLQISAPPLSFLPPSHWPFEYKSSPALICLSCKRQIMMGGEAYGESWHFILFLVIRIYEKMHRNVVMSIIYIYMYFTQRNKSPTPKWIELWLRQTQMRIRALDLKLFVAGTMSSHLFPHRHPINCATLQGSWPFLWYRN